MSLAQLPPSTIQLIRTSQIITCVSSAVKELMENALDAGATSIEIKLVNYGLDRIEVKDNGAGIDKEDTSCMALPHFTSKIKEFSDLESLETYGFRGEALNALCQVSQVTVTTATSRDQTATVYTLDSGGNIVETKLCPPVQGTTVDVSCLFKNLPVRRQLMKSNRKAQEELKQVETVVKALAVIKPSIRVTLRHNKCLIWQKFSCTTLKHSFSQLVGYATSQQLEELSLKLNCGVQIEMLLPKTNCDINAVTRSTASQSLVFINDRPVRYKKIVKILQQTMAEKFGDKFPSRKFPVCLISITLAPSNIDVNLEPDKTKILVQDEDVLIIEIERRIQTYYRPRDENRESNHTQLDPPDRAHAPQDDLEDDIVTKKRKIDSDLVPTENLSLQGESRDIVVKTLSCSVKSDDNLHGQNVRAKTICEQVNHLGNSELEYCPPFTQSRDNPGHVTSTGLTEAVETQIVQSNEETVFLNKTVSQELESRQRLDRQPRSETLCEALNSSKQLVIQEGHFVVNCEQSPEASEVQRDIICHGYESELTSKHPDPTSLSGSNMLDEGGENQQLDDIHSDVLKELVECLDTLSNETMSHEAKDCTVGVNLVGTEAWSMGHITAPRGAAIQGSSVLVGGLAAPSFGQLNSPPSKHQAETFAGAAKSAAEENKLSPQKNSVSPCRSPRLNHSNGVSPGINSSLQSVSSQMGRRELAAFTKFAREVRPQIILENPGISFTLVASTLAEKWQSLSSSEREHYEDIARETATAKKIWKTSGNQKKLAWVKELPIAKKEAPHLINPDRPPRKEVQFTVCMSNIKEKSIPSSLSTKWDDHLLKSSAIYLIGRLEPSGTWICMQNGSIYLLNHCRLQELVVFHRLLGTHALALKPLPSKTHLDQGVLGDEAWRILVSLPCYFNRMRQTKVVTSDIVVKNGFKIEVHEDNMSADLTEVAEALNFYGVKELKETLDLGQKWPNVQLSECRPLRVVSHIKSEAMRICRKAPAIFEKTLVTELLEYWKKAIPPENMLCLHSRPILTHLYNINHPKNELM